jgi:UDP-N-acetylmuramoyl-L-alanyl-D-glutamate--2,6-diaminopimelate ligase
MSVAWTAIVAELRRDGLLLSGGDAAPEVLGLATDSRAVVPGDVFFATRGTSDDGHRFVGDATSRGAAAVIGEQPVESTVPHLVVRDGAAAARVIAALWHDYPADRLELIGITGTNGKTTTTALVRHLLNEDGRAGSVGTLGAFDGGGNPVPSTAGVLTTPGPVDLQATLASLVAAGVSTVVMEVSSHSLDQGRLSGLSFGAGVFTNLSRDHLDYHDSMEDYRTAKLRLVDQLAADGVAVVNDDDPAWCDIPATRVVRFGTAAGVDVRIGQPRVGASGSSFEVTGRYGSRDVTIPLVGTFNVENAAAAAAVALALGRDLAAVVERLADAPQVPGRMERIATVPCPVIRDYAHTPDALERVLRSLRPLTQGRIIAVFGCGGDRDAGKRPIMGRIAEEYADVPVLTSDNPRTEDPEAILDDVERGMHGKPTIRNADRRQAIAEALASAQPEDTVLLAGKGHETYQIIGSERLPFDEAAIVRELTGS